MPNEPAGPGPSDTRRGLTAAEVQELTVLQAMMRSGAYMTEEQRRQWFELSQRQDLMRG